MASEMRVACRGSARPGTHPKRSSARERTSRGMISATRSRKGPCRCGGVPACIPAGMSPPGARPIWAG